MAEATTEHVLELEKKLTATLANASAAAHARGGLCVHQIAIATLYVVTYVGECYWRTLERGGMSLHQLTEVMDRAAKKAEAHMSRQPKKSTQH